MPHSRVVPEIKRSGGRIVAQMKFRALAIFIEIPFSTPALSSHAPSLIPSSFFRYLLLFRSADRTRPQQRRAFPAGEARRADEYLSERKTNSRSAPTLSLPASLVRPLSLALLCMAYVPQAGGSLRGGGSAVCLRKKVTPSGEPQLRASHCLREGESGMQGIEGGGLRYRGGSKKRRAHTRRSSANI